MEKKINLLFGIIGGPFLVFLQLPLFSSLYVIGEIFNFNIGIIEDFLSFIGLIFIIYFSILLIIDTVKTIHKK